MSSVAPGTMPKVDNHEINTLLNMLYKFNQFDTKMQVSTIITLLEIAKSEVNGREISTGDIEKRVGLLSGTATRNVYYWADGHKDVRGAHQFVEVKLDISDRRRRLLRLTHRGRAFVSQLLELIPKS